MTEKQYEGFEQIAESDIIAKSVASLRNVPGRGGTYGENGLTAQELKERFDALPKLAIERLHALLTYLDAYINGTGGLESRLGTINAAIADANAEISANSAAISAEETARKKAISAEKIEREQAITKEATDRASAIDSAISAEVVARDKAIEAALKSLIDNAPEELNTLKELAEALAEEGSATNALLTKISEVEADLGGKVDAKDVSTTATPNTIAKRGASGRLAVGRASADSDAVPYKQMREELERYLSDGGGLPPELLDGITNAIKMIDTLEAKVANLEAGLAPDMFTVDDATAYVKTIPADAAPYAEISAVGGMTHKGEQLDPVPFNASFADNEWYAKYVAASPDGTVVFGYDTQSISAKFNSFFPSIVVGKKYMLSVDASGGTLQTASVYARYIQFDTSFVLTEEQYGDNIYLSAGIEDNGEAGQPVDSTFKFSLREVTDVLLDTPVTALDIVGKNLYNGGFGGTPCATEENGVLTMTKTADNRWTNYWYPPFPMDEASITYNITKNSITNELSGEVTYESGKKYYVNLVFSTTSLGQRVSKIPASTDGTKIKSLMLYISARDPAGASATLTDIMILPTATPTDTTFSPYHKTTFAIPAAVQALDGYGKTGYGIEWDEDGKPWWVTPENTRTDISHLITEDNLIPVEGGGTITAVNENALAAPTTIVYQATGQSLADAFDEVHEYAMQKIGGNS